jgi:hypothetical protein
MPGDTVITCDACGAPAGDGRHIRDRIERLELATRFRPIHIQVLVLDAAPLARREDYFYRFTKDRSQRSTAARRYFDELTGSFQKLAGGEVGEESALEDFQRRGLFLTYVVECPTDDETELASAVARATPTLLKRLQASYRPKSVALLSPPLEGIIPALWNAGWSDRLILEDGKPFASPSLLRGRLEEVLIKAS